MPRTLLVALLIVAIVCAGVGVSLLEPFNSAGFGWTAYSPLSSRRYAAYLPVDPSWLVWRPRVGALLLALGAGTTGAALAALVMRGRPSRAH